MKAWSFLLFTMSVLTASSQVIEEQLIARTVSIQEMWDQEELRVFGFAETLTQDGLAPGPILEFIEGDSVELDLWNMSQGAPHTIHLHGLDVDQANDGVPHLSFEVTHMDHGYYYFVAPHPGTYLYHCHVVSSIHVQAGMYGLLIVRPATPNVTWDGGYAYHQEKAWLFAEMDSLWHQDSILDHNYGPSVDNVFIPDYNPQYFLVNGKSEQQLDTAEHIVAAKDEVVYVRLANVGYYGNRVTFPTDLNAQIICSDGRPFSTAEINDTLWMTPGERYGVLLESSIDLSETIAIDYYDLNTQVIKNTQLIDVTISGELASVTALEKENLKVYPNPSSSVIKLNKSGEIKITDALGKLVWKQDVKAHVELNLPLENGWYQLSMGDENTALIITE